MFVYEEGIIFGWESTQRYNHILSFLKQNNINKIYNLLDYYQMEMPCQLKFKFMYKDQILIYMQVKNSSF